MNCIWILLNNIYAACFTREQLRQFSQNKRTTLPPSKSQYYLLRVKRINMFYPVIFVSLLVFHAAVCEEEESDGEFALVRLDLPHIETANNGNKGK